MPALMPLTTPVVFTEATAVLEVLQVPPVVASVRFIAAPAQTVAGPLMVPAAGVRLTVSDAVLMAEPQDVV